MSWVKEETEEETETCNRCGYELPLSEFSYLSLLAHYPLCLYCEEEIRKKEGREEGPSPFFIALAGLFILAMFLIYSLLIR